MDRFLSLSLSLSLSLFLPLPPLPLFPCLCLFLSVLQSNLAAGRRLNQKNSVPIPGAWQRKAILLREAIVLRIPTQGSILTLSPLNAGGPCIVV